MKTVVLEILCVAMVVALIAYTAIVFEISGSDRVYPLKQDDAYLIHAEELRPMEAVTDILVADGMVFVHFEKNELVNVYSVEGKYQYGYQIQDGSNGDADIFYQDGLLYFKGKAVGIYVFQGTELVAFEEKSIYNDSYDIVNEVFQNPKSMEEDGYSYHYVKESDLVIRTKEGVREDIIQFPDHDICTSVFVTGTFILIPFMAWIEILKKPESARKFLNFRGY